MLAPTLELVSEPVVGAVLGLVDAALPATPPPVLLVPVFALALVPPVSGVPCRRT